MLSFLQSFQEYQYIKSQDSERDVFFFGEYDYKYGNVKHPASEIPPILKSVIDKIIRHSPDANINSCLITRYTSGQSCIPSHQDNEPFIDPNSDIYTLSIGCTRSMIFKNIKDSSTTDVKLMNNNLLSFSRYSQEFWTHGIPKDESTTCRYSLTFRYLAPMFLNSTLIMGDSNTNNLNFGSGKNTFGIWMPGMRIKAGRIQDVPEPSKIKAAYRHFVIHTGINDIRSQNPKPIPVLASNLFKKCTSFLNCFPKCKVHISLLLPSKDPMLNISINQFNSLVVQFCMSQNNCTFVDNSNLADPAGFLYPHLGRHTREGNPKHDDAVHLGSKGISTFCMNIKKQIVKMRSVNNVNPSNNSQSVNSSQMPNWNNKDLSVPLRVPSTNVNMTNPNLFIKPLPQFPSYTRPPPPPSFQLASKSMFPPLPIRNSSPFIGDYQGAVCSSFQLNKYPPLQNDGYQT